MNNMKQRGVLVTGGAGYIGSTLVRALLAKGYRVRVLDTLNFTDASLEEIKDKIELVNGDIQRVDDKIFDGIDSIIHLAGFATEPTSQYSPRYTNLVNHVGTERIAKMAKEKGINRFVFASSCSVYFTYNTPLEPPLYQEKDAVNPISPYSLSKRAAEEAILELTDTNFKPVIFRKGTVFGFSPRMRYDLVVNSFVKNAFAKRRLTVNAGGQVWRPLIDIQDVVWAYIKALELPLDAIGGKIFNVAHDNWNILALAECVKEILKKHKNVDVEIEVEPAGITRNYKSNNTLFQNMFHFKPRRTLDDAVLEIWNHLEKNPDHASNALYYNDKRQIQLLQQGLLL